MKTIRRLFYADIVSAVAFVALAPDVQPHRDSVTR